MDCNDDDDDDAGSKVPNGCSSQSNNNPSVNAGWNGLNDNNLMMRFFADVDAFDEEVDTGST